MKKPYSIEKRKKITITIDADILSIVDKFTSNRSNLINMSLKDYLNRLGFNTEEIKCF